MPDAGGTRAKNVLCIIATMDQRAAASLAATESVLTQPASSLYWQCLRLTLLPQAQTDIVATGYFVATGFIVATG